MPPSRRATRADKQTDSAPSSVRSRTSASKRASAKAAEELAAGAGAGEEPPKSPKQKRQTKPRERKVPVKQDEEEEVKEEEEESDDVDKMPRQMGTVVPPKGPTRPKLPVWAQFPLLATLSFSMASMGYSLLGAVTKGELAAVSRSQDTWGEVAILAGWRLIELALAWFGGLDSLDAATLDLLSHGPSLYLLSAFYGLSPFTARASFIIETLSAAVPFYLLRPLSAVHNPNAKVYNRELASWGMQLYTGALSTGIYSVTIVLSLRYILPRVMVVYFAGIPSLEAAYGASYAALLPVTLQFGAAASNLIYAPFATTPKVEQDDKIGQFDPAAATLGETVAWNVLGYTAKTKVIVRRTALAVLVTAVNTYLALMMTIYGIEPTGAAAYAGVWAAATLLSGLGLAFVGGN